MPKLLKDEKCSICNENIKSVRYPNLLSSNDDWDFRKDISLEYGIVEFENESWLHNVKFEKRKSWVLNTLLLLFSVFFAPKLLPILAFILLVEYLARRFALPSVLICGYCQLTLDSLNEFHTKKSRRGLGDGKWYYWKWAIGDSKTKVLNKPLTKAFKNIDSLREKIATQKKLIQDAIKGALERKNREKMQEQMGKERAQKREKERLKKLKKSIIKLLKVKVIKMPASDIDAFLKHQNVDEIKELCEQMYHNSEISRTANYRYFILTEEKKQFKKASAPKSESTDIPEQIKKLSDLKDQGILTEEEFQSKKKDLLDKM